MNAPLAAVLTKFTAAAGDVSSFIDFIICRAVEKALEDVARDYGLNAELLKKRYIQPLLQHFTTACTKEEQCKAVTARGKRCALQAVFDGHCGTHVATSSSKKHKSSSVNHYHHHHGSDTASYVSKIAESIILMHTSQAATKEDLSPLQACQSSDHTPCPSGR